MHRQNLTKNQHFEIFEISKFSKIRKFAIFFVEKNVWSVQKESSTV